MDGKGKQRLMGSEVVKKEAAEFDGGWSDEDDVDEMVGCVEDGIDQSNKKKRVLATDGGGRKVSGGGGGMRCCQAEKCKVDLSDAKPYHRRHKVCEHHAKAEGVVVAGIRQRFCQQCSRFHELLEFDETKRSCRRRLAGHNERRRKNSAESQAEGSSRKGVATQLKDMVCGQVDDRGRIKINIEDNATYKHFQIR